MPVTTRSQSKSKTQNQGQEQFIVDTYKIKKHLNLKPKPTEQPAVPTTQPAVPTDKRLNIYHNYNTFVIMSGWFTSTLNGLFQIIQSIEQEIKNRVIKNGFDNEAKKLFYDKLCFVTQIMQMVKQNVPILRHMPRPDGCGLNELCMAAYKIIPDLCNQLENLSEDKKPTTFEEKNIKSMLVIKLLHVNKMLTPFLSSDHSQMLIQNK